MSLHPIPGTAGFLADVKGNIYAPNGKRRNQYRNGDGYCTVAVKTEDGRWVTYGIHRLIARTFIVNDDWIIKSQVNHRDPDLENNAVENLEWVSAVDNIIHSEIMRRDNLYPTVLAYDDQNNCLGLYLNAHHAADAQGIHFLDVWDSIKEGLDVNGVTYKHRGFSQPMPVEFRQPTITVRDKDGRVPPRAIKLLDILTGEIRVFDSMADAAKEFGVGASHLHQSIPKPHYPVRTFKKQYQVAYVDDDFPEISKEELERAVNHGPREVYAYNTELKMFAIYGSAKSFIEDQKLSKKAVTVALAENKLKKVGDWYFLYMNKENVTKLQELCEGPKVTEF